MWSVVLCGLCVWSSVVLCGLCGLIVTAFMMLCDCESKYTKLLLLSETSQHWLADLLFSVKLVNARLLFDPVQVILGSGEASRVANLTPGAGPERDDAVLHPPLQGLVVVAQRASAVSVAGSLPSGRVHAHHTVPHDAVDGVALGVGDEGKVLHHPEDWTDTAGGCKM